MNQSPASPAPPLTVIVLAAGKGTRMRSRIPKVLQPLAGRPMLAHVLEAAGQLHPASLILVAGHGAAAVQDFAHQHGSALLGTAQMQTALQEPQLGTGDALRQAASLLPDEGTVLVLLGDVPLLGSATLQAVLGQSAGGHLALLTARMPDPHGYGRIVRNATGHVQAIVEHRDASATQLTINEINSGIMAFPAAALKQWLARLRNDNAQGEYYLTDVIAMAAADGVAIHAHCLPQDEAWQVCGVNSAAQLAACERQYQRLQAAMLMAEGVRLNDPERFDLRAAPGSALPGRLSCGQDVEIDAGCIFSGDVQLGEGTRIGACCHVAQAVIGHSTIVQPYCHIDGEGSQVVVGANARIGPFARLRPGSQLGDEVHIGNFVEVKNSQLAHGAKANHLSYLGDARLGEAVNIGAGTITANYDGVNKHRTVIEAQVHVGSNSVLVAPVTIGTRATIGAGSVIVRDVAPDQLALTRADCTRVDGWQRPKKKT